MTYRRDSAVRLDQLIWFYKPPQKEETMMDFEVVSSLSHIDPQNRQKAAKQEVSQESQQNNCYSVCNQVRT